MLRNASLKFWLVITFSPIVRFQEPTCRDGAGNAARNDSAQEFQLDAYAAAKNRSP